MDERKYTEIKRAMAGPIYNTIGRPGRVRDLGIAITSYAQRRGTTMVADTADRFAGMVDDDIAAKYGDAMTFAEAKLALDWGVRGEYGDSTGINPDRLFKHVRSYMESEDRREARLRKIAEIAAPVPQGPSNTYDRYVWFWNTVRGETIEEWTDYKNGAFTPNAARDAMRRHRLSACYYWLRSVGLIGDTAETRAAERNAVKEAGKTFPDRYRAAKLAGATLLENYFKAVKAADFDLDGELAATGGWSDDAKFAMKWFDLE